MVAGNLPPDGPAPAEGWDTPAPPPEVLIGSGIGSGSSSATANLPGGTVAQAGDLLVVACVCRDNVPNNPAGYTQQGSTINVSSSNARGKLWTKVAAGGETGVTVTTPGSDSPAAAIALFRPRTATHSASSTATAGPSTTPSQALTAPGGTQPYYVVGLFAGGTDGAGNSGPVAVAAGWTEIRKMGGLAGSAFCPYGLFMYRRFEVTPTNPSITSPNQRYGAAFVTIEE